MEEEKQQAIFTYIDLICFRKNMERDELCEIMQRKMGSFQDQNDKVSLMEKCTAWFEKAKLKVQKESGVEDLWFWVLKEPLLKELKVIDPEISQPVSEKLTLIKLAVKASELVMKPLNQNASVAEKDRLLKKINEYENAKKKFETGPVKKEKPQVTKKSKQKIEPEPEVAESQKIKEEEKPKKRSPSHSSKSSSQKKKQSQSNGLKIFFQKKPNESSKSKQENQIIEEKPKSLWNNLGCFDLHETLKSDMAKETENFLTFLKSGCLQNFRSSHSPVREESIKDKSTTIVSKSGKTIINSRIDTFFKSKKTNANFSIEVLLDEFKNRAHPVQFDKTFPQHKFVRFEEQDSFREFKGTWDKQTSEFFGNDPLKKKEDVIDYEICSSDELLLLDAESCSKESEESDSLADEDLNGFLVPDEQERPTETTKQNEAQQKAELTPVLINFADNQEEAKKFCGIFIKPIQGLIRVVKEEKKNIPAEPILNTEKIKEISLSICGFPIKKDVFQKIESEFPSVPKKVIKNKILNHFRKCHLVDLSKLDFELEEKEYLEVLFRNLDLTETNHSNMDSSNWIRCLFLLLHGSSLSTALKEEKIINPLLKMFPKLNKYTIDKKIKDISKSGRIFTQSFCNDLVS